MDYENSIVELDVLPVSIRKKAVSVICNNKKKMSDDSRRGWKKIQSRQGFSRYRLNRNYRMVVKITQFRVGPFQCMKHSTFDRFFR